MLRFSLIATLALAPMVSPATASADECTCVVPGAMFDVPPFRVYQSLEVGPLFSSDGALLSSAEATVARARRRAAGEVLLCVSADDPRCAPRDSAPGNGPHFADGVSYAATHPLALDIGPLLAGEIASPRSISGARSGVRDRVERPPRA
jgi:hypothetical protein